MNEVTRILLDREKDEERRAEELLPLVYEDLRRLAVSKMAREAPGQTLQPTALVHEAWLRLVGSNQQVCWANRAHFFSAAAEAMRRILIDRARRRHRPKHGGGHSPISLDRVEVADETPDGTLLLVDEALEALAREDPQKAELVKLRFYVGLNGLEAGEMMGLSESTTKRWWAYARAWLMNWIQENQKTA